jgi:hypothetical protein
MSPPIIGYRAWRVVGDYRLQSVFTLARWPVRDRMEAECRLPNTAISLAPTTSHTAPSLECSCGIYARTTLAGIFDELWRGGMAGEHSVIVGAVAMFGSTFHGKAHPHTIRAQYAQPICLLAPDAWYPFRTPVETLSEPPTDLDMTGWRSTLYRVSEQHGLPIVARSGIEKYAAEFGEPLRSVGDERVTRAAEEPRWRSWWPWG